jgi:opacity protein-like surface antigen
LNLRIMNMLPRLALSLIASGCLVASASAQVAAQAPTTPQLPTLAAQTPTAPQLPALAIPPAPASQLPALAGTQQLPVLALDPQPPPSLWHGLYVGTEVFAIAGNGHKGHIGGDVQVGYDHEFANNIVLGVEGTAGYSPSLFKHSNIRGFDFATADAKVGYDMGRLMPYVTTGVVLAKPHFGSGFNFNSSDSFNNVINGGISDVKAATVGVGADYALTSNTTIGVSLSVTNNRGFVAP